MGKQKCISKENGRNFSQYNQMFDVRTRKKTGFCFVFFKQEVSVFQCEIVTTGRVEFNIFLCTAEHPIPNSIPYETYCSGFQSPHSLEIKLK